MSVPPEIPAVVRRYLEAHGLVAVPKEPERPVEPGPEDCPFPLYRRKFGLTHSQCVAWIGEIEGDPLSGLDIMQCEACGNVSFATPIALAGGSP